MSVPVGSYMVGMGAPYSLVYRAAVRSGDTWVPGDVTAATMTLREPNGTEKVVAVTVANVSPTGLDVVRALVAADLDEAGDWVCTPTLTIPSGTLLLEPVKFYVRGKFQP